VIVQQINLYQDQFKEKRLWVSATQVAAVFLVLAGAVAIWSFLLHNQLEKTNQHSLAVKADQSRMTAELASASAELAQLLADPRLDEDIADASRQISARKKVLVFVDANQFGSGEGFSSYLIALSNLHVSDVWLSRIRLAENFVQIKGSSLSAESVPGYFDRFSEEAVFQGNRFDLFKVSRAKDTNWKVDFEIATRIKVHE
jgi:hypothetical protein